MIVEQSLGVIYGHMSSVTGWQLNQPWSGTAQEAQAGGRIKEPERCLIGHPKADSDAAEMERVLIKEPDELSAAISGR